VFDPTPRNMRRISALPNLLTLGNAFCGLLAIAKAIDALALSQGANDPLFYAKMQTACWLIFLGMIFDALDGKVARMTGGGSEFGAQLDSFSDALTFGCAPALLAKVLIEHDGPLLDFAGHPRLHFIAAAAFALMAILRLARFNLETSVDEDAHQDFKGLPSPAAAGALVATMLMFLTLKDPKVEYEEGALRTPVGMWLAAVPQLRDPSVVRWFVPAIAAMLPLLGFLMVSRVRYVHAVSILTRKRSFFMLVYLVFAAFLLYTAPVPMLFVVFNGFVLAGVARSMFQRRKPPAPLAPREVEVLSGERRP
jgi:CDP-diacylglycerol--serine O-phosphatidyltransferase